LEREEYKTNIHINELCNDITTTTTT